MKQIATVLLLIALTFSAIGQVQFVGLLSNAQLKNQEHKIKNRAINLNDTLLLPFIDDFAYNSVYPSLDLWLDQKVYINNNFANNPPSVGVATFDILDENGVMYAEASGGSFVADTLTSKPINLSSFAAADSIYLSFYYQPKGNGWDSPNEKDSLVLQFYTNNKNWHSVWSKTGTSLQPFEQVMISVIDTAYFKNHFQFRFYNYASIDNLENQEDAITNDFWNIDYVVLDTARSINTPSLEDISITYSNNTLFQTYYSVPWKHYNYSQMPKDSIALRFKNLDIIERPANNITFMLYQDHVNLKDSFNLGSIDIPALMDSSWINTVANVADDAGIPTQIPNTLLDSTELNIVKYFDELVGQAHNSYAYNDTIRYTQKFYNYYAFDDGTAESGLTLTQTGEKFAFKINGLVNDTLRGVSMFFNRYKDYGTDAEALFSLCVWDDNDGEPGQIIYQEDNISPKYSTGKNQFSTYKFETGVFVEDTFYVGFINDYIKTYSIGYDLNNNNNNQVFYTTSNSWYPLAQGVPMIRPLMGDNFIEISVPEKLVEDQFNIYPNPTQGTICIDAGTERRFMLQVFSSTGKLLVNKSIDNKETLQLNRFGSGLYIVRIQNKEQSISKKVIVL